MCFDTFSSIVAKSQPIIFKAATLFQIYKNLKTCLIQKQQQCLKATLFFSWGNSTNFHVFFWRGMAFHPQKISTWQIGGRKPKAAPKPPDSPLHWVLRWGENSLGSVDCRFWSRQKNLSFRSWKRLRVYQTPSKNDGRLEGRRSGFSLPFWVSANFQGLC